MTPTRTASIASLLVLLAGCASGTGVDPDEPRRLVGRSGEVRLDAQLFAENLRPGTTVRIVWEVTNGRETPIAIAELVPAASYEPETRTVTVELGSEVPGNEMLPRLVRLAPGEKQGFSGGVRIPSIPEASAPQRKIPRELRIRLSYLSETAPFESLIGIPERAIRSAELADELFEQWVEATRTVTTNSLPIEWRGAAEGRTGIDRRIR